MSGVGRVRPLECWNKGKNEPARMSDTARGSQYTSVVCLGYPDMYTKVFPLLDRSTT